MVDKRNPNAHFHYRGDGRFSGVTLSVPWDKLSPRMKRLVSERVNTLLRRDKFLRPVKGE